MYMYRCGQSPSEWTADGWSRHRCRCGWCSNRTLLCVARRHVEEAYVASGAAHRVMRGGSQVGIHRMHMHTHVQVGMHMHAHVQVGMRPKDPPSPRQGLRGPCRWAPQSLLPPDTLLGRGQLAACPRWAAHTALGRMARSCRLNDGEGAR